MLRNELEKKRRLTYDPGQKRHSDTTKTTATSLAKFMTSIANDDILLEILTRLETSQTVWRCAAVCRRWSFVISHPRFVPLFKRQYQKRQQQHQRHADELQLTCLPRDGQVLPADSVVRASCKDLLLVQALSTRRLCVFNPLTRQQLWLPECLLVGMNGFALMWDPNSEYNYIVFAIEKCWWLEHILVVVFRSKTGHWDESVRTITIQDSLIKLPIVVGTSDGVVYAPAYEVSSQVGLKKIAAFDPFDHSGLCHREVSLPSGFKRGWRGSPGRTRVGVVRGQLRLWQAYLDKRLAQFVFKVWVLNKKYDDWVSLYELCLATGAESKLTEVSIVMALHPEDDGVFFFKDSGPEIWRYSIWSGRCEKIGESSNMRPNEHEVLYVVSNEAWPTAIPQLRSI